MIGLKYLYKNVLYIFIVIILIYIMFKFINYIHIRLPYFDGSHHFSELMNYALAMRDNFYRALITMWDSSPELFGQYTLIAIFSNLLFYARSIFLVIYLMLLVSLFWKVYCYSNKNIQQGLMLYILLVTSTILVSSKGGVLDTRIDVIAIILFCFAILEIFNKNTLNALLFTIIAMFLKSSMLFLSIPFLLYMSYKNLINLKQYTKFEYIKLGLSGVLLFVYLYKILLKSIAYNLMSTGGENFTPFSSKHLCMRKGAIQFCFKLLICGIEWETFMGEVECKLLERNSDRPAVARHGRTNTESAKITNKT